MAERIPASAFILTKDSAATIRRALESVADFDDIVVCDGGSRDETVAIASAFGANVVPQDQSCLREGKIEDYSCARNACLSHTRYDWVFYIDSDEVATPELIDEIRGSIAGQPTVYEIAFELVLPDRIVRASAALPSYQIRFFHKATGARFIKKVHERIAYDASRFRPVRMRGRWQVIWDLERIDTYWRKARAYLALESSRHESLTRSGYFSFLIRNLGRLAKRIVKVAWNTIRIPARQRMPLLLEMNALAYDVRLIGIVTKRYFSPWKR